MRRSAPLALGLALGLLTTGLASAQDTRFDVQAFRPMGTPYDLVTVGQSEPLRHLKLSGGAYLNFALDPLVLVAAGTHSKAVSVVGNRLQLDAMAAVGLFNWVELGVDMPLVLAQGSDNLEAIGTEGYIQSFTPGDVRLTAKVAVPGLRRTDAQPYGMGAALTLGMGLPTGSQEAFASDGEATKTLGLMLDYRFESDILLALNAGLWLRPDRQFAGVQWGNSATFGLGAEVPILTRNIAAVGMLTGSTPLDKFPNSLRQIPAELLLGLRWYGPLGLTFTVGGGGGCGCSLTAPTLRMFTSVIWGGRYERRDPTSPSERDDDADGIKNGDDVCPMEAGEPALRGCPRTDTDKDGIEDRFDACPTEMGPQERSGCPRRDQDKDGVEDEFDSCPDVPMGPKGRAGCPLVRIQGNKILILDQVHFATDQDIILPESFPILDEVADVMLEHLEIQRVLVEGHTDSRATDAYNFDLSRRRAASVMTYLLDRGIVVERLCSAGFGRSKPLADNKSDEGMALNRRVEFTILPPASDGLTPPCPPDPAAEYMVPQSKPGKGPSRR